MQSTVTFDASDNHGLTGSSAHLLGAWSSRVVVVADVSDLEHYASHFESLLRESEYPNPFFEPWFISTLIENRNERKDLVFVLMFDVDIDIAKPKDFIGFFPFERTRVHRFIPLPCLRLWRDFDWSFRSTPLIRIGKVERCIETLAHWLGTDPKIPGLIDFNGLVGPSALGQALTHWLSKDQRFCHFLKASNSHLFHCKETAEAYFSCVLSKKRQDDFRRKRRQLEALGPVRFVDVDDCDDIHAFIDEFLELEARGWKGKSGTAMIAFKDGAKTARALL